MKSTKDPLFEIVEEALRIAKRDADKPTLETAPNGRELEILFYGMMCFDPLPDRPGYRVLFPNGLNVSELEDIPVHAAGLWVRDRGTKTTARWSGFALRNDFFLNGKQQVTISGLAETPFDATAFEGRVTNLRDCDSNFTISDNPDAVIDMIVDRGTLSAHVVNNAGMIVVRWAVQTEDSGPVRFTFGNDFVEIPADVTQVFLANVSATSDSESERHFQLFRRLSKYPKTPLKYQLPKTLPTAVVSLKDPTFGYGPAAPSPQQPPTPVLEKAPGKLPSIVGVVPQATLEARPQTPDVVCSAVVSRLRGVA